MNKTRLVITGNIGCGKSVVSRMLSIMGVPVYDCDSRAKMLMQSDEYIKRSLVRMFGEECYSADGSLNRAHLASCIFIDRENVKRVNELVHPRVKEDFVAWAEAETSDVVAVETAILYESGMIDVVDKVLLVWADEETAIKRVTAGRGMSRQQVISRLQNQMSADDMLILSDYSLRNDSSTPILPQLIEIMGQLQK